MAIDDGEEPTSKRRRRNLMVGEAVEVGHFHEGLQSWHLAVVIECGEFFRVVEHTNRSSGDRISEPVEVIPVSDAIEGTFSTATESCRPRIRPVPPHVSIGSAEIRYGLCVDALVDDAWWEGVVFDHGQGFEERRVLFPDLGDQAIFTIERLRLTQDWDEASGHWNPRGQWLFLQLLQNFDCAGSLPVPITQIWCDLRATHVFQDKIKSWAFGTKDIWEKLVSELIEEEWSVANSISVNICTSMEDVICPEGADHGLDDLANGTDDNCSPGLNTPHDRALISGSQGPCQLKYAGESSSQAGLVVDSTEVSGADGFLQSCNSTKASMKPGVCSKALQDFIQVCRNEFCPIDLKKKLCVLRQLARSHLMAVGWKFIEDVQGRKYYVSPLGKRFGSLITACEAWKTVEENSDTTTDCTFVTENHAAEVRGTFSNLTSMHSKAENIPSCSVANNWKPLKLDASYCPEVVEAYASKMKGGKSRLKSLGELDSKSLSEKVKKHLAALGWTVEFREDTILRFRFSSPQGRIYYSLIKACSDLQHQKVDEEHEYSDDSEHDRSGCSNTKRLHSIVDYHEKCSGRNFNCAASGKKKVEFRADEDIEPEYLPEAITEYEGFMDLQVQNGKRAILDANAKLLRLNAKRHLLYMGWFFYLKDKKTKQELCYRSPCGKSFHSLITACKAYLKEDRNSTIKPLHSVGHQKKFKSELNIEHIESEKNDKQLKLCTISNAATSKGFHEPADFLDEETVRESTFSFKSSEFGERKFGRLRVKRVANLKKKSMLLSPSHGGTQTRPSGQEADCQKSKGRVASQSIKQGEKMGRSFSSHVRRSSTTLQQLVESSSQHSAKTVLSWLIDNDILLPRQKVYCMCEKDGQSKKEGRINRDGIKCMCCKTVFDLASFVAHSDNRTQRPSATIFLSDGRSLLQCQMQMMHASKQKISPHIRLKGDLSQHQSDTICSICQDGGRLILCDHCPSAFHITCIGLEDVPDGKWFCPSCRCGICDHSEYNHDVEQFTKTTMFSCDQCEGEYHVGCLRGERLQQLGSCPTGNWFCSEKCLKTFYHLCELIGKSNPTPVVGLSWTLLRWSSNDNSDLSLEAMAEHHSKLCIALDVLHECFVPMTEPRTQSDLVADLLFNKESELKRLNFWGFYTMLLEKGDELVSVATFRVYGDKVAEMPLIGTRVLHRRKGMCRLLVNELEKLLRSLGVERLLLPAVPQLLQTWTTSFGFTQMTSSDRLELSKYPLLSFSGTTMCQKLLGATAKTVSGVPAGR
ncbi:PHD-finger [Musa troglodytarum]|nr:PHD-finger [Musa troglodytarum]